MSRTRHTPEQITPALHERMSPYGYKRKSGTWWRDVCLRMESGHWRMPYPGFASSLPAGDSLVRAGASGCPPDCRESPGLLGRLLAASCAANSSAESIDYVEFC